MNVNTSSLVRPPTTRWWIKFGANITHGARWLGRSSRRLVHKLHPDLRKQLTELPWIALTQLAPRATPDLPITREGDRVVVFVHGYGGSRGNFIPMQSYFRMLGHTQTLSVGFKDTSSIECMADELRSTLWSLIIRNQIPAGGIDIVAHSLGGIISRVALNDPELCPHIRTLITLASPHGGSELARYLDTPTCRGLRPGSELLQKLQEQGEWGKNNLPRLISFWTPKDCILLPAESAQLEGAENICMPECTHLTFLLKPAVWFEIVKALEIEKTATHHEETMPNATVTIPAH